MPIPAYLRHPIFVHVSIALFGVSIRIGREFTAETGARACAALLARTGNTGKQSAWTRAQSQPQSA